MRKNHLSNTSKKISVKRQGRLAVQTSANRQARSSLKVKSGLASFYIVTFVTLVLSVVVLSFVQVAVIDTNRTSNDDLYQSAYDSALAGVEDARTALVKYQECQGQDTAECNNIRKYIENGEDDCDSIAHALGRIDSNSSGEVPLVEKSTDSSTDGSQSMDQAYTCVTVSLAVPDFRGTLTSNSRVSIVPIRTSGSANDVKKIRVAWFSDSIKETGKKYTYPNTYNTDNNGSDLTYFTSADEAKYQYPPITVDLYQTDATYTLGELSTNSSSGTDHASFVLQPASNGDHNMSASDVLNQNDKYNNFPEHTKCDGGGEFNCYTTIELPNTFRGTGRSNDTFLLRLETPYGQTPIDFTVTLLNSKNEVINFYGVQARVDSTGRANDLVRRVETRIDYFADFPYPEFAIQLNPGTNDADTFTKNFSVSRDCWYSEDDGVKSCDNSNSADGFDAF